MLGCGTSGFDNMANEAACPGESSPYKVQNQDTVLL
jgi:hypothetical protein